jgi:hypothetical protein
VRFHSLAAFRGGRDRSTPLGKTNRQRKFTISSTSFRCSAVRECLNATAGLTARRFVDFLQIPPSENCCDREEAKSTHALRATTKSVKKSAKRNAIRLNNNTERILLRLYRPQSSSASRLDQWILRRARGDDRWCFFVRTGRFAFLRSSSAMSDAVFSCKVSASACSEIATRWISVTMRRICFFVFGFLFVFGFIAKSPA